MTASSTSTSSERCKRYRKRILEISQKVTCHVAPAFSCMEIVDALYNEIMAPHDIFIMSKGHGSLAQYVVLEERGQLDLSGYCNGSLGAHPDKGGAVMASTGSLGHGLGIGVGMAYAEKLKKTKVRVFVLMSDGELQEGSTWEAVQMAANLGLGNLMLFVDKNGYGGMDRIIDTHPAVYPVQPKFSAMGWNVTTIFGNDGLALAKLSMRGANGRPYAVVCSTVKGHPISYMIDEPIWHYKSPDRAQYEKALEELN